MAASTLGCPCEVLALQALLLREARDLSTSGYRWLPPSSSTARKRHILQLIDAGGAPRNVPLLRRHPLLKALRDRSRRALLSASHGQLRDTASDRLQGSCYRTPRNGVGDRALRVLWRSEGAPGSSHTASTRLGLRQECELLLMFSVAVGGVLHRGVFLFINNGDLLRVLGASHRVAPVETSRLRIRPVIGASPRALLVLEGLLHGSLLLKRLEASDRRLMVLGHRGGESCQAVPEI